MNTVVITYLAIVGATLAVIFFLLKYFGKYVFSFVVAITIYGAVSSWAAVKVGHDFFMIFQLLAIGAFAGGTVFLALCTFYAYPKFKLMALTNGILLSVTAIVGADAFLIEPHMLEVTRHSIVSNKVDSPLRIAILADFQTDKIGDYERSVLKQVADENPDLFLLPGDYIQTLTPQEWTEQRDQFKQIFKDLKISPKHGTFAVQGNVDDFACWQQLFCDIPGHTFEQTETVSAGPVDITGLGFYDGRNSDLKVRRNENSKKFHIVMSHYPDFSLGKIDADLLVAGHCHGGQVQVPFYGPIITASMVPKKWVNGNLVHLPSGSNLVISRGVGMERHNAPRLRFCCRPQLIFVNLMPERIRPQAKAMMSPVVSSWDQVSEN